MLCEPESEAVALRLRGDVATGAHHFGYPSSRHDLSREERPPEGADVGDRGVDPAVTAAADRQVEHVASRLACDGQVPKRGTRGEFVRPQELGINHPGRPA